MITLSKTLMVASSYLSAATLNPVKMSLTLLMVSSTGLLMTTLCSGQKWFPLVIYMLFVGGILVMFMILSSSMPNQKSMKIKMSILLMCLAFVSLTVPSASYEPSVVELKSSVLSSRSMSLMTLMILTYFFLFIKVITSKVLPIRGALN